MPLSDQHLALMKTVRDSGAIDFAKLGQVVTDVTPQLFNPDIAADNYIATGYSDVVKVWKTSITDVNQLANPAELQQMGNQGAPAAPAAGGFGG